MFLARFHSWFFAIAVVLAAGIAPRALPRQPVPAPAPAPAAPIVVVLVVDGLRPDTIDQDTTPTLFRLSREGTSYSDSHASFPP